MLPDIRNKCNKRNPLPAIRTPEGVRIATIFTILLHAMGGGEFTILLINEIPTYAL